MVQICLCTNFVIRVKCLDEKTYLFFERSPFSHVCRMGQGGYLLEPDSHDYVTLARFFWPAVFTAKPVPSNGKFRASESQASLFPFLVRAELLWQLFSATRSRHVEIESLPPACLVSFILCFVAIFTNYQYSRVRQIIITIINFPSTQ